MAVVKRPILTTDAQEPSKSILFCIKYCKFSSDSF